MYDFLEDCSTYLTFMKFILDTDWAKTFEMKENQSIAAKEFVKIRQWRLCHLQIKVTWSRRRIKGMLLQISTWLTLRN
jgi:hypothetical protein